MPFYQSYFIKKKIIKQQKDDERRPSFQFMFIFIIRLKLIDCFKQQNLLFISQVSGVVYQKYQILPKLLFFIQNNQNSTFNEDFNVLFFLIRNFFHSLIFIPYKCYKQLFYIYNLYILLIMEAQQTPKISQNKPQFINIQNTKEVMKSNIQQRLSDKKMKLQNHVIQGLLNVKQTFGPFSPKIAQFIVGNVKKKPQANKVKKIYNQICLLPQLSSIHYFNFNQQFLEANIDKLVEFIQQKNQQNIINLLSTQFKENQVQILKKQIFSLFSNQVQNQKYQPSSDVNEKMIDEKDQEIQNALIQEQTNIQNLKSLFREKLLQKQIKIQESHLEAIIKALYQFGAYSIQTTQCLQKFVASSQKKIRRKIVETFNQIFKQIIIPKQVQKLLEEKNGFQQKQMNQIKQLIRQGDQQKLLKYVEEYIQLQKKEQIQSFVQQLLALRNNEKRKKINNVSIYKAGHKIEHNLRYQTKQQQKNKITSKQQTFKGYKYKKRTTDQVSSQINSTLQKQQNSSAIQKQLNSSVIQKKSKKTDKNQKKDKQDKNHKNLQGNNFNKDVRNKTQNKQLNQQFKEYTQQNLFNSVSSKQQWQQKPKKGINQKNQFKDNKNSRDFQGPINYSQNQGPINYSQNQGSINYSQNQGPINYSQNQSSFNYSQNQGSFNYSQKEQRARMKNENHEMSKKINFVSKQSLQTKFIVLQFDRQCYNFIDVSKFQGAHVKASQFKNQLFQNNWLKLNIYQFKVPKNHKFQIVFKYEMKQGFFNSLISSPKLGCININQQYFSKGPMFFLSKLDQSNQYHRKQNKKIDSPFLKMLVFLHCTKILDTQKKYQQLEKLTQYFKNNKIILKSTYLSRDLHECRTYCQKGYKKWYYRYSDLGSKILVLFFSQKMQLEQQLLNYNGTDLKQQISYLVRFQTTQINGQFQWMSQNKYLKQIMLNIMFRQKQNKHSTNQSCFLNCFQSCYKQKESFRDHFQYLLDLSHTFPQLCKKIYYQRLIKLIGTPLYDNKNLKLTQFFILNIACLNVINQNKQGTTQIKDVYQFQRKAILDIFLTINNLCDNTNMSQDAIEQQNRILQSFIDDHKFSKLLKEVLNGQTSHNKLEGYFLFSNQYFYNLWLHIFNIKEKRKIQFIKIFNKICGKQRLQKGFLSALKSDKSSLTISFMLKHKNKSHLENLFNNFFKEKQIPYKQSKNMLELIQYFYGDYYNHQNSAYFVQIFQKILTKNPKIQINSKQMLFLIQRKINQKRQIQCSIIKFLNQILQKYIFNYLPGINEFRQQLEQIKFLNTQIKHIYLDVISQKITNTLRNIQNKQQTLQTKAQEIIYSSNSLLQDKHYILKKLFTEVSKSKDQIKKFIYKCLQQGSKRLIVVSYYNNFQKALMQVLKQIESKQIQYGRIKKIKKSIQFFSEQYGKTIGKIYERVQQINGQVQKIKKQITFCKKIMTQYDDRFEKELQMFKEWQSQLDKNKIIQSIKKIKKYQQILQFSEEIYKLMKIPLWNKDKIFNLKDLLIVRIQTIQQLQKLTKLLQENRLTYLQFKKYFNVQILQIICEKIEQKKLKDQVFDYTTKLQDNFQQKIRQYVEAINSLYQQIQKRQYFDKKNIQVLQNIANADQNYVLEEAYRGITYIITKFKQIGFNIQNQTQIQLSILNKKKYQRVFELVNEKKIDSVNIISDLEEYVTDMEDSILKMEDIKELQNICKFNQMIKKSKSVKQFFSQFEQIIKNKEWRISQNIRNIDFKYGLIQQKIDQCANRQTSFKYDLAAIFKHSIFRIKDQNMAQIQIQIRINQKQKIEIKQATKYSYKKLAQFKDKALLLVIDYKKSTEIGLQLREVIQIFKKYIDLFKEIQEIHNFNQKVIIFGYNPNNLGKETQIFDGNFQNLIRIKDQLKQTSAEWINGIQSLYDSSFMLTHFIGPNLNQFVQKTLEFQYNPILKQILQVEEKQFKQYFDSLSFAEIHQKQKLTPFEKVKKVCKLFQKYQKKILKSQSFYQQENHTQIKKHIQLVSCVNTQDFYFALSKQKQNPKMNQVLYCQNQTSKEQIDIFLKRSMIKHNRKHYILGAHQLKVQVQLNFCDLLSKYLQNKQNNFQKSKLCFIDNSTSEKLYLHLCKQELFRTKKISRSHFVNDKIKEDFIQSLQNTYLIQSRIAGLGKTFQAQHKFPDSKPIYFSVGGNISFSKLLSRLKRLKFQERNTLIIQIGHIENKKKLQIFLFYICFFRGFNYKQFFFIPKNTNVVIQIQNIYQEIQKETSQYHLLKILRQNGKKHIFIKQFRIQNIKFDFSSVQETFTFHYLKGIDTGQLNKTQQSYQKFKSFFQKNKKQKQIIKDIEPKKYIKNFFFQPLINKQYRTQPTFWLYKSFLKLLFTAFKTFSQNGCFNVQLLEYNHRSNKSLRLDEVRINFLKTCIKNCIQFLQSTINTNEFQENKKQIIEEAVIKTDFRNKLSYFPFLIMPAFDFQNYQFVYLDSSEVDDSIKSMLVSQKIFQYGKFNKCGYQKTTIQRKLNMQMVTNLFISDSLQQLRGEQLERQFFRILHQLSGNNNINISDKKTLKQFKEENQNIKNYSITLDNFFKMCLIVQRAVSHIPIIIMGESGVGKTALIRFLVQQIFNHQFQCFNIHAGVNQETLIKWFNKLKQKAEKCGQKVKVWGFFDEFNTTDQLSYIKQMLIDRRFQGQAISDNIILMAACNPYRKKKLIKSQKKAGIAIKSIKKDDKLAFRVNPPPLSMIQFMWDYQQLLKNQNQSYIGKILQSLQFSNHQTVVKTISLIHQYFKKEYEISSVSLRDVTRFKQLYIWFRKYMPKKPDISFNKKEQINPNYEMNAQQRAISLSLAFCYSLRIANKKQRNHFLEFVTKQLDYQMLIEQVVKNQQTDYVNRLKITDQKIAINFSLRQNVFTTLVCLINKIPILIIGNPGNSKSLSIRMISSNLTGQRSSSQFCKQFPQINMIYFQGSQTCTSKGIQGVFQKAIKSYQQFKKKALKGIGEMENCILFDQIGLAQKSIHNPLKVLHSELQTNKKQICFIGISNWELDAAKMSRFLVLSRSAPQKQQLEDTSVKILASYLQEHDSRSTLQYANQFRKMAEWYFQFINQWDKDHHTEENEGFFGLRDFYCYIKYVAQKIVLQKQKGLQENIEYYIKQAIKINFDGQKDSVNRFFRICGFQDDEKDYIKDPIKLVKNNLQSSSSRCLLLIVKGDALIPIIQSKISVNGAKCKIHCIYGSTFKADQQSEQYNLQITSLIISHISRGNILAFKDINNSIQTSMYDLFNKSFTTNGNKKYCRIAVGANSNPKCLVHPNFNSIVFIDQEVIKQTDLAFLNRFQKHYLNLGSVLNSYQTNIVQDVQKWIDSILSFKSKTQLKKRENYLINSCQESLVTLVIKHSSSNQEKMMKNIKKALLKNSTTDFKIALKNGLIAQNFKKQIQLLKQTQQIDEDQSIDDIIEQQQKIEDRIIYTYDQQISSLKEIQFQQQRKNIYKIRISQIKCQKQLRNQLKHALLDQKSIYIHILIDYQGQLQHINMVIFLALQAKKQFQSNKPISIIIQLSRSSFVTTNRETINISYLHKFEQCFIERISWKNNQNNFQQKSLQELYLHFQMEDEFKNIYTQAMKRFKLILNQERIKFGTINQMQAFYFESAIEVCECDSFKRRALKFIYQNLTDQKINSTVFLNSKQDIKECHNIQQSIQRYLKNKVINLICNFFQRIYKNNLLFCFNLQKTFQFYSKYSEIQVLRSIYQNQDQKYQNFLSSLIQSHVENKALHIKQFNRKFQSNPLEIQQISLFPMSSKDFKYILNVKQDSLIINGSKLLNLVVNKNQDKDISQQYRILLQKCNNVINQNSIFLKDKGLQKYSLQQILNENKNLQFFYFFDLINNLFSKTINSQVFPLERIVYLFVYIFRKETIKQKIIILALSQQLWSYIFNIWSLWIVYNQKNFHKKILQFYSDKFLQPYSHLQLPQKLIQICKYTLQFQQDMFFLNSQNIHKFGMNKYLQYFRKTYYYNQKLRIYCMEMDIQLSQTLKATKRFFDLLDKIFDKQQIEQSIAQFISIQQNSFQAKVQIYLDKILIKEKQNKNKINLVITYLSLDIYSAWIQRLLIQKQQSQLGQITNEMKACFNTFFKYANDYEEFANNSTFFLQQIFNQFSQFQQVQEKIQYLRDQANDIICFLQSQITFENNISVALGNFLMNDIENMKQSFEEAQRAQFKDQMNEGRPNAFVSQFLNLFKQFIQQKEEQESNVFKIYKIQFCKTYLHQYLRLLDDEAEPYLINEIDKSLCKQNKNTSLLKLYLLKVMLSKEKTMNNIKNIYLIPKKCRWIEIFREIIQGKSFELLVPPNFQEQQKILQMINEFRSIQYQDFGLFQNILKQSFVSPFSKYQFLTFMMNDIYTRSCPQDRVLKILQIIENASQYSQQNQIQLVLLKRYCKHQINSLFKYEIGHEQLKIQQFVQEQLVFINYLNILVSCSKTECPLIQMFFNNRGHVPDKYFNWLQQRFLILGKQNLSCSILNGILQRNDINSGYYRCSSYCDFFYVIGGTGYGCKNPSVRSTCPWCKKGLGGVGDRLDRINQGAQKYQIRPEGTQLTKIREEIRQKKRIQVLNLKLNGYGYSPNHNTLLKQIQENNRISYSPKALMQEMFLVFWGFLIDSKLICQDDVQKIFKDNSQNIPQLYIQTSKQFNKDLKKKLNFEDQSSNIIWHLGISKEIMKFVVNYKRNLSQQKQSWMGLVKCKGRDMFQQQISKLILNFSNGKEKQDLVNRSRTIKSGVNLSGQQIVRQNDCYKNHLDKYPQIRMIKLIHKHKSPSYQNLIKEYGEIIQRDYPILSYCIMKEEKIQKLIVFRKMYLFISKLIKILNLKITRKQASVKSITKIISDILNQGEQIQNSKLQLTNQWKQQIFDFCNYWNQLRNQKFQLQYDCHNFGSMDQTTIKLDQTSPAVNFLPDNKYKGDQKGQMLLSFLQVSARQYNVVCTEIQNIRKSYQKYRQTQIFNPNEILPTQIQPLIRTLEMSAQRIEEDFIFNFSAPSVQYGVSLPHYPIDKIQSLIVQNMVGSHIINEQIKEYDIIHYIGQQENFINQFRNYNEQIGWENIAKNQEIESFIYILKHKNPDAFIKEINSLKGSFQKIMMYYKYKKIKLENHQQSLGEFIRQNEMMLPSRQIQKQLFSSLSLSSLLSVYQFIQVHTLQNSSTQLNQSYKKERMTQMQVHNLSLFKETIKQNFKIDQNIIYHISVALYRFVCRKLLLVQINEERILYDYISEGAQLWPKQFDLQKLKQQKYFVEAFSIKLSKIGHLLQLIPLQLKKTKAELIMIDTERQVNNSQRKKPETLNQTSKLNKKKKNI